MLALSWYQFVDLIMAAIRRMRQAASNPIIIVLNLWFKSVFPFASALS